jgi:O-antigen/teichoic acid export membrane protein
MKLLLLSKTINKIPKLFDDNNLTKKASLNAFASALDYSSSIIVNFIINPILVSGLGNYYYGVWQILTRLVGYISPASGRPAQALKFTLAKDQYSTDIDLKRSYIGSSFIVLGIFIPLMSVLGGLLTWFVPYWIKAPTENMWYVRIACAMLVMVLVSDTVAAIPRSVLQGERATSAWVYQRF